MKKPVLMCLLMVWPLAACGTVSENSPALSQGLQLTYPVSPSGVEPLPFEPAPASRIARPAAASPGASAPIGAADIASLERAPVESELYDSGSSILGDTIVPENGTRRGFSYQFTPEGNVIFHKSVDLEVIDVAEIYQALETSAADTDVLRQEAAKSAATSR